LHPEGSFITSLSVCFSLNFTGPAEAVEMKTAFSSAGDSAAARQSRKNAENRKYIKSDFFQPHTKQKPAGFINPRVLISTKHFLFGFRSNAQAGPKKLR
jgi:hypothetical protein